MAFNILFVCTGNTCRSPMAEALLKQAIPGEHRSRYSVSSAGTHAANGLPASGHAITAMQEEGVDISKHRARLLTENMVEKADLLLALAPSHLGEILDRFPEAAGRAYLLSEYADRSHPGKGVADPMGGDIAFYRATRDEIKKFVTLIAGKM